MGQSAMASIEPSEKTIRNVVYRLKTIVGKKASLDDIKYAMDNIAVHMETLKIVEPFEVYVVFFGDNIKFLEKEKIDPELSLKIRRFLEKGVKVGVCTACMEKLNISPETLVHGLDSITIHE